MVARVEQRAVQRRQLALAPDERPAGRALHRRGRQRRLAAERVEHRAPVGASPRIRIDNGSVHGSIALKGSRLDDVTLANYRETIDPNSPEIVLLSPVGSANPYFADYGWVSSDASVNVPGNDTLWSAQGAELTDKSGVDLRWDNDQGLSFGKRGAKGLQRRSKKAKRV